MIHNEFASTLTADCLAWHVEGPRSPAFLTGGRLLDAAYAAASATQIDLRRAENIATMPGLGLTARSDGRFLAIGTVALFASLDIRISTRAMRAIAAARLSGNDVILIGSWHGVDHVCPIANPTPLPHAA